LACGEILRVLTHYNRPIFKVDHQLVKRNVAAHLIRPHHVSLWRKGLTVLQRPLSPWITDILLAAPLGIRSDYFRW
jgi:GIGANTEA protein